MCASRSPTPARACRSTCCAARSSRSSRPRSRARARASASARSTASCSRRGTVTIYSEVGHGTTVNLYLPRVRSQGAGERTTEAPRAGPAASAPARASCWSRTIAEVRDVTRAQLETLGYARRRPSAAGRKRIDDAGDVGQASISSQRRRDARAACRASTSRAGSGRTRPALQVLLTSGYPDAAIDQGASAPPAHRQILRKPFSRGELARALRKRSSAR